MLHVLLRNTTGMWIKQAPDASLPKSAPPQPLQFFPFSFHVAGWAPCEAAAVEEAKGLLSTLQAAGPDIAGTGIAFGFLMILMRSLVLSCGGFASAYITPFKSCSCSSCSACLTIW